NSIATYGCNTGVPPLSQLEYCEGKARYTTEITTQLREAYVRGLLSDPGTANAKVGFYNLDGESSIFLNGFFADAHPALWYYGAGRVQPTEPAQAWQAPTFTQHLAGPNIYVTDPSLWYYGNGANHGMWHMNVSRYYETS